MKKFFGAIFLAGIAIASACSGPRDTVVTDESKPNASYMPKAIVYRTTGNYSDLVPITLDNSGNAPVSFPAPSDLTESTKPLPLGDGWYLDRRGIGPKSVFTSYTYKEYSRLSAAPAVAELMSKIEIRNPFTAMYRLPISNSEASANPSLCRKYIDGGFNGCEALIPQISIKK